MTFTLRPRPKSRPKKPPEVAWTITRITGTPAKYIGQVDAPDEHTAVAKAIEEFGMVRRMPDSGYLPP
jgi:hypothetical protein